MRVREWMSHHPVVVTPRTSVLYARRLLERHRVRHLPVVADGDRLVGIVSDRDIMLRDGEVADALVAVRSELASGRYRHLDAVMSAPARVVGPDDPLSTAVDLCLGCHVSALPVVEHDRLVGIITTTDLLRAFAGHLHARATAEPAREPGPAPDRTGGPP